MLLCALQVILTGAKFIKAVVESAERYEALLAELELGFADTFAVLTSTAEASITVGGGRASSTTGTGRLRRLAPTKHTNQSGVAL